MQNTYTPGGPRTPFLAGCKAYVVSIDENHVFPPCSSLECSELCHVECLDLCHMESSEHYIEHEAIPHKEFSVLYVMNGV